MKRIKLFEEFNADLPMEEMIKQELKKEIQAKLNSDPSLTLDDIVNYYHDLTQARNLDKGMANDIFHDLVDDGVFNTKDQDTFTDDSGLFTFTLEEIEVYDDMTLYVGELGYPDHTDKDGKTTLGFLHGSIVAYNNGQISPEFNSSEGLNVESLVQGLDDGLESLDNFLHYVVGELEQKNQ